MVPWSPSSTRACILVALALAGPALGQRLESDKPIHVALNADDPAFEGHGSSRTFDYRVGSSGELCVWAASRDLVPYLRIDFQSDNRFVEDDNHTGGTTALVVIPVQRDDVLQILVAAAAPESRGEIVLQVSESPDTEATLAAAARAREAASRAKELLLAEDFSGARAVVARAVTDLFAVPGSDRSRAVETAAWELGEAAQGAADLRTERTVWEHVYAFRSRIVPDDYAALQTVRSNLGTVMAQLGDLGGARDLLEKVLCVFSKSLPQDHPFLQTSRQNLASVLDLLGDLHGARELEERVLEVRLRTLSDDDHELQAARGNLAGTIQKLGDLAGARELQEKVLEVFSRTLSADDPDLQWARQSLANTLYGLGDVSGARSLCDQVLEVRSRTLPDDHADLQAARGNVAAIMLAQGEFDAASALEETIVDVLSRTLPDDHPDLQAERLNLADTRKALGDLQGARALDEQVLSAYARTRTDDDLVLQLARANLMWIYAAMGAQDSAFELAGRLASSLQDAIAKSLGRLSPRELEERVTVGAKFVSDVLSLARGAGLLEPNAELERHAFSVIEARRSVAICAATLADRAGSDPELARLAGEETVQAETLARLAQEGGSSDAISTARRTLDRLARERMALLAAKPDSRALLVEPTADALGASLAPDQAIVAFSRYTRSDIERDAPGRTRDVESLLAFVLRPGSAPVRVELGPIEPIERAAAVWRSLLENGGQRGDSRGVSAVGSATAPRSFADLGSELSRALVVPLLPALKDTRTLVVALDDVLEALPLDALPLDEGLVGDRFALELHLTLRELVWKRPVLESEGSLVALGGASFDEAPAERTQDTSIVPASGHARPALLRGSVWEGAFAPLPATAEEARGIVSLFRSAFGEDSAAVLLEQREASKTSVRAWAPKCRTLHLATHGWIASESVASSQDVAAADAERRVELSRSSEGHVRGTSPMLLCGLALAGANQPSDELGHVEGLVTAEEIASWDLHGCELAVLSACDTNVGVRRAGQGVASLQKALHMAGARSVITSLWKVPDNATKELMLDFYRRLWVEKRPKWQALWEAKKRLREARDERGVLKYSPRDWAAWVLTGDPN